MYFVLLGCSAGQFVAPPHTHTLPAAGSSSRERGAGEGVPAAALELEAQTAGQRLEGLEGAGNGTRGTWHEARPGGRVERRTHSEALPRTQAT